MATTGAYNRFKRNLAAGAINLASADVRVLLVSSLYTFSADHNFVSDITNELSGTGYARKVLASKVVAEDDTNDRATFDADDLVWTGANFGTPDAAIVYVHNASDAAAELICCLNLTTKVATNGGDFTATFDAVGLLRIV